MSRKLKLATVNMVFTARCYAETELGIDTVNCLSANPSVRDA